MHSGEESRSPGKDWRANVADLPSQETPTSRHALPVRRRLFGKSQKKAVVNTEAGDTASNSSI